MIIFSFISVIHPHNIIQTIPMFCGIDSILWNIPHAQDENGNILQNIASPT